MDTNNTTPNSNDQPNTTPITSQETPVVQPENKETETQYQGVLNNYKEEMNPPVVTTTTQTPVTETTTVITPPTPTTTIPTLETPAPDYSNPEIAQKKLEEILNMPTGLPPSENSAPVGPIVDTSPKSSLFRTIFLVALFLFLGVSAAVAYFFIKGPGSTPKAPVVTPVINEVPTTIPTVAASSVCTINDKQYKVGETFAAADGCNICSCAADLTIVCTERVCNSTPSATLAPTKAATNSAVSPTKAATNSAVSPTKAL